MKKRAPVWTVKVKRRDISSICRAQRAEKWETRNLPQSADEAIDRAFRVQRHDVSDVKETGFVL